jgi:hypothetical protein
MKCKGAILRGIGGDWEVEEITLDSPREGEVLVKIAVAGVCHSDNHYTTGDGIFSPKLAAMVEAMGGTTPCGDQWCGDEWCGDQWCCERHDVGRRVTRRYALPPDEAALLIARASKPVRSLGNPAGSGCRPTGPRRAPIPARSRTQTGP